jgi:co-chaperonin GroES (HSP10)
MNRVQKLFWAVVGMGFIGCATAADALPPSLRACMKETDAIRRLACFDHESAVLAGESAPVAQQAAPAPTPHAAPASTAPAAAATAATAGAAAATTQSATDKFGYKGNIAREDLDKQKAEEEGSGTLTAKVTAIENPLNRGLVVTLDNGQVWQQKTADSAMRIKVGDQVTIKHAMLGSFLLTSDTVKGSMRVSRVK